MAASRKLQLEIEKSLKKVQEGIEEFQETWDKMMEAPEGTKKEKCELELKKELKRLQRIRDNIRTWLTMPESKPYIGELETARRQIEVEMERFKQCEKASKIKAFSKEGLVQQAKVDPSEQAKVDAAAFLSKTLDSLQLEVDKLEAEVESLTGGSIKTGKKVTSRILELEGRIVKHCWHKNKLEQILRLLENEEVTAEEVDGIKDRVAYYIEAHEDPDFLADDEMYDDFPFHKLTGKVGEELTGPLAASRTPTTLLSPKVTTPASSPAANPPEASPLKETQQDALKKLKGKTGSAAYPASAPGSKQSSPLQDSQAERGTEAPRKGVKLPSITRSNSDVAVATAAGSKGTPSVSPAKAEDVRPVCEKVKLGPSLLKRAKSAVVDSAAAACDEVAEAEGEAKETQEAEGGLGRAAAIQGLGRKGQPGKGNGDNAVKEKQSLARGETSPGSEAGRDSEQGKSGAVIAEHDEWELRREAREHDAVQLQTRPVTGPQKTGAMGGKSVDEDTAKRDLGAAKVQSDKPGPVGGEIMSDVLGDDFEAVSLDEKQGGKTSFKESDDDDSNEGGDVEETWESRLDEGSPFRAGLQAGKNGRRRPMAGLEGTAAEGKECAGGEAAKKSIAGDMSVLAKKGKEKKVGSAAGVPVVAGSLPKSYSSAASASASEKENIGARQASIGGCVAFARSLSSIRASAAAAAAAAASGNADSTAAPRERQATASGLGLAATGAPRPSSALSVSVPSSPISTDNALKRAALGSGKFLRTADVLGSSHRQAQDDSVLPQERLLLTLQQKNMQLMGGTSRQGVPDPYGALPVASEEDLLLWGILEQEGEDESPQVDDEVPILEQRPTQQQLQQQQLQAQSIAGNYQTQFSDNNEWDEIMLSQACAEGRDIAAQACLAMPSAASGYLDTAAAQGAAGQAEGASKGPGLELLGDLADEVWGQGTSALVAQHDASDDPDVANILSLVHESDALYQAPLQQPMFAPQVLGGQAGAQGLDDEQLLLLKGQQLRQHFPHEGLHQAPHQHWRQSPEELLARAQAAQMQPSLAHILMQHAQMQAIRQQQHQQQQQQLIMQAGPSAPGPLLRQLSPQLSPNSQPQAAPLMPQLPPLAAQQQRREAIRPFSPSSVSFASNIHPQFVRPAHLHSQASQQRAAVQSGLPVPPGSQTQASQLGNAGPSPRPPSFFSVPGAPAEEFQNQSFMPLGQLQMHGHMSPPGTAQGFYSGQLEQNAGGPPSKQQLQQGQPVPPRPLKGGNAGSKGSDGLGGPLWERLERDASLWAGYMNMEGPATSGGARIGISRPGGSTAARYQPQQCCEIPRTWPRKPIAPEHEPALFEKLGTDALFFAFYFQQNTFHQYLAARELKKQSWRYHKKFNTWFQRHNAPPTITEEYERGSYVYFDYHLHTPTPTAAQPSGSSQAPNPTQGWCHRMKSDFIFEYEHLEDDLDAC